MLVAVLLYGFSKTAMPVAGVLAGPLLAAALGATTASGLMVPLLILGDLFALALYRQHADWAPDPAPRAGSAPRLRDHRRPLPLPPVSTLGRIIGVLILASLVLEVWRRRSEGADRP